MNHIKIRDAKILWQNKCQSISSNEFIQISFPNSLENNYFSMHLPSKYYMGHVKE